MEGKAFIDGKLACEATLTCMIVPRRPETTSAAAPKAGASSSAGSSASEGAAPSEAAQ
jgi:3-hydroxyacyl-[acyl-carrier-protein] dehydratase